MDSSTFRRKARKALGINPTFGISDYELACELCKPKAPLAGMSKYTIYNWLKERSKVPGPVALLISIHSA